MPGLLADDSRQPGGWGWPGTCAYFLATALATLAFNGSWLFTDRVGILDWPKELFYFHYLRASLLEYGALPVSFFTIPESLHHFSTLRDLSWWSNPEVFSLSPFLPLLWFLPTVAFIKAVFGLHYLAGIAGTGLLSRRLGLSPAWGAALYALAALNPWLVQHLAIGYSPYVNMLLFPGVAALLLAPPRSPVQTALAALGCAWAFYQGALHLFVWFNLAALAVAALACLDRRSAGPLARVLWMQALTFVLIFPKYRAVSFAYADFVRSPGTGYASWADLWGLLTDATSPVFDFPAAYDRYGVAFYDGSLAVGAWFVGLFAAALLAWPVVRLGGDAAPGRGAMRPWIALAAAALFLALGWGGNWAAVTRLVPTLASEIYPFRWLFPAYLFAAAFTVAVLSGLSRQARSPLARAALLAALLPCLWAFFERGAFFAEVMNREEDIFEGFSMREHLTHRVVGLAGDTLLPADASPGGLTLAPPGSEGDVVLLPWLEPGRIREFQYVNMRPDIFQPEAATAMVVTAPVRPVSVLARTHDRGLLGALCAALFLAMVQASRLTLREGRAGRTLE